MRILFCNIAWMKYYRGNGFKGDRPYNGGSYVEKHNDAAECMNFKVIGGKCYGNVSIGSPNQEDARRGVYRKLRLENFNPAYKGLDKIDDVLVVWVARENRPGGSTRIVGWYRNATVYRDYQCFKNYIYCNVLADSNNCYLLDERDRKKTIPQAGKGAYSYGKGESNVWYARGDEAKSFVSSVIDYINQCSSTNLVNKPDDAIKEDQWVVIKRN